MKPDKLKICFIVDYYPPHRLGGVGESASYLKDALQKDGHDLTVLTTGTRSSDRSIEMNVFRLSKGLLFFPFSLFFKFPSFLKKHEFDIIHFHHSIGITALLWKWIYGKRFPATVFTFKCSRPHIVKSIKPIRIGNREFKPSVQELKTKLTFSILGHIVDRAFTCASDLLTANSGDTREKCMEIYGISEDRIVTIPNGVDIKTFHPGIDGKSVREKYYIDVKDVLILYVGGFSIRKRVPLLLYVMNEVKKENNRVKLMIVGSGKGYEPELKQYMSDLGLDKVVIFTGFVENSRLPLYYAASDIVVVPSEYEPFGIINIEAMAMAKPVIASAVGGIGDIVENDVTGYTIEKDDLDIFIDKVLLLSMNVQKRKTMGEFAVGRILKSFTWDMVKDRYLHTYRRAIEKNKNEGFS
jgi:glycosyltransferase involved in cell wall biosynthesis